MKKTKKLAALVLAMVMAFSLMAVTAAAYDAEAHTHDCAVCCEGEGIMPLKPVYMCPWCGGIAEYHEVGNRTKYVCLNRDVCGRSGYLDEV